MKITHESDGTISIDQVTTAELGHVLDTLRESGVKITPDAPKEALSLAAEMLTALISPDIPASGVNGSTGDPLDTIYTGVLVSSNGNGRVERQHLEAPELDDDDALARIAHDAYMTATNRAGRYAFEDNSFKPGWRAAAAAVRAAALLQRADRVVADA